MLPWTKELKIFEGIEQQNLFTLVNLIQVQIHDKAETFHPLCDRKKEKKSRRLLPRNLFDLLFGYKYNGAIFMLLAHRKKFLLR